MDSSVTGVVYLWHEGVCPPPGMRVTQVYGWVFDDRGRVVMLRDGARWNLPGGTPEPWDRDQVATLVREVAEEVQVEIADPHYIGYQEVRRDGEAPYAQLRMAARITRLASRAPDPDSGRTHVRRLCSLPEALALLGWGPEVEPQAKAAAEVATAHWGYPSGDTTTDASTD